MGERAVKLFRECIPLFHALGDPARQDILLLLSEHDELNVTEIAKESTLSRPAISHHLKIMRDVGLLNLNQKGTQRYYSLNFEDNMNLLKELIQTVEKECYK